MPDNLPPLGNANLTSEDIAVPERLLKFVSPVYLIAGTLFAFGAGYWEVQSRLAAIEQEKAGRVELASVERNVERLTAEILREMRIQRLILCRANPDTYCAANP
jgi:hypothetical protein